MHIGLACFVKTIGYSPVKTRLAADIGTHAAEQFYRTAVHTMRTLLHTLSNNGITPYWAVAEPDAVDHPQWHDFPAFCSRPNNNDTALGACLDHCYRTLFVQYDGVLLIGSDTVSLEATTVLTAVDALRHTPFVLGPSTDGGFYLFAGKKAITREQWCSVPYSTDTTCRALQDALPKNSVHILSPVLDDIDDGDAFARIKSDFSAHRPHGKP